MPWRLPFLLVACLLLFGTRPLQAAEPAEPASIVVTPLRVRGRVPPEDVEGLEIVIAGAIQRKPQVHAILPSEVRTLLGLEAQKQLLGCSTEESSSCMTELGGALGATYVLGTEISRVGTTFLVQVALIEVATARSVYRATGEAKSLDELLERLKVAVAEVLEHLPIADHPALATSPSKAGEAPPPSPSETPAAVAATSTPDPAVPRRGRSPLIFWSGTVLASGLALGGGLLVGASQSKLAAHNTATSTPPLTFKSAGLLTREQADRNVMIRTLGLSLAMAGTAGLIAELLWGRPGRKQTEAATATVFIAPGPDSLALGLGGRF